MKVKELIKELKKMPQNLKVGVAMHDNDYGEVAGWVSIVNEVNEEVFTSNPFSSETKTGNKCVILQCN